MIMMPYGWTLAIAAAHRPGGLLAPHRISAPVSGGLRTGRAGDVYAGVGGVEVDPDPSPAHGPAVPASLLDDVTRTAFLMNEVDRALEVSIPCLRGLNGHDFSGS